MRELSRFLESQRCLPLAASAVGAVLALAGAHPVAATESRSYVVSEFTNAAYSTPGDCEGGVDPNHDVQYRQDLLAAGVPPEQVKQIMQHYNDGGGAGFAALNAIVNRGRVDGKPVNGYTNPATVADPHLHMLTGRYAFGFNLDGKGAASPNSFEDPVTHERGVNNQLDRVFGCLTNFRGPPAMSTPPMFYSIEWHTLLPSFPAWLITITGDDLSRDGPVSVSMDRSIDRVLLDANGNTEANATFRIDPDPRSVNVFHGRIEHGVLTLTDHHDLHLVGDPVLVSDLDLSQTHLRLTLEPDGRLDGIIGGYQPWTEIFFPIGHGGNNFEVNYGDDIPGLYYALKRLADADPDPKSGENRRISVAWHLQALPALVMPQQQGTTPTPVLQTSLNGLQ